MPHKEEEADFTPDLYPSFPEDPQFPGVDLQTISLQKLLDHDAAEEERVFEICKGRGFFYLDLAGPESGEIILRGSAEIGRVGAKTMALPMEEKTKYLPAHKQLFGLAFPRRSLSTFNELSILQLQNRRGHQSRLNRRPRHRRILQRQQKRHDRPGLRDVPQLALHHPRAQGPLRFLLSRST